MQHNSTHTPTNTPPRPSFIVATLKGGAHDGQTLNVPSDEITIELIEGGKRHRYDRPGPRPVFYHRDALARMIGGAK